MLIFIFHWWEIFSFLYEQNSAIMQNRVFTPFLLRFWKWTMKSESFSNAVLHFDKFYLKYRKQKRFEQWRTQAVCCRHLPTTTFGIFWECNRFLDQKEIFKKRCQNSLNVNLHSWNTELKNTWSIHESDDSFWFHILFTLNWYLCLIKTKLK